MIASVVGAHKQNTFTFLPLHLRPSGAGRPLPTVHAQLHGVVSASAAQVAHSSVHAQLREVGRAGAAQVAHSSVHAKLREVGRAGAAQVAHSSDLAVREVVPSNQSVAHEPCFLGIKFLG